MLRTRIAGLGAYRSAGTLRAAATAAPNLGQTQVLRAIPGDRPEQPGTPRALASRMTTTMGELVSDVFARYEQALHDEELAAVATQVRITELLAQAGARRRSPRRKAR
jgi:hypothetical protein